MKRLFSVLHWGILLFFAYLLQYFLDLKWNVLYELQLDQMYKRWSGLGLLMLIVFQWLLTLARTRKSWYKHAQTMKLAHQWVGAFSPILFYVHTMEFGYGYLALLSYIFFANMALGVINLDTLKSKKQWVFQSWMITHVAFSVIISFLSLFHIGVVFYYK